MDVFDLHKQVITDYSDYTKSFIRIRDDRIKKAVDEAVDHGLLWPDPLLQLNPAFEHGDTIDDLVREGVLDEECGQIFRIKTDQDQVGKPLRLHRHQSESIRIAARGEPYVLTTGTGSGKSLSYIIPAVDHVLRTGSGDGIKAIVVYPMNALANSQHDELSKFLDLGYDEGSSPVTFHRYTGQEGGEIRERLLNNPPDILLTNYVMLELILTRINEQRLIRRAKNLRFLVLDELHTYRGRQGADVAMLVRRCRETFSGEKMICVGTSATMVSKGDSDAQMKTVAEVATKVFGTEVPEANIIGESLRRTTEEFDYSEESVNVQLREAVESGEVPCDFTSLQSNVLASWIESTFGIDREASTGKLVRQRPRKIEGEGEAAEALARLTGCEEVLAISAIQRYLQAGTAVAAQNPDNGFPLFAFRLHQFITRGDTVWGPIASPVERAPHLTLRGQQFVPGDRAKVLLPFVFCRGCGQEYYRVEKPEDLDAEPLRPRERFSTICDEGYEAGYVYISEEHAWPENDEEIIQRVPNDWVEERDDGSLRIRKAREKWVPQNVKLGTKGKLDDEGIAATYLPAPFRFCLNPNCRVSYGFRQRGDSIKLATIGVDGRSTATTILALAAILRLRADDGLDRIARKLLSFTDNRQDASLQAGHFNDFVEVGLIRSALYRAMMPKGEGLDYDELVQRVEQAMNLPIDLYAEDPELRGQAVEMTKRALRSVLQYFLYRDMEAGWRVTSPNLEQCGLLKFEYIGLEDAIDESFWAERGAHGELVAASADQRKRIITVLLDHLRRNLIIKEDSLTPIHQERISEQSRQRLKEQSPWRVDDPNNMVRAGIAWPRSRTPKAHSEDLFLSAQSNYGMFLSRRDVLPLLNGSLSLDDRTKIIRDLLDGLRIWGLVEEVRTDSSGDSISGYQVPSSIMRWTPGDGSKPMIDPLKVTEASAALSAANEYFVAFYKTFVDFGTGLEAREHTAQVDSQDRQEREARFKEGVLPILFCSPTMELGIDIKQLNVVNMRNVPPSPANYAQRSGRAGRSGQPAFVYTYCSGYSPHDQYYFKRPSQMVSGVVTEPRIDLLNRDLIRAHVHAIWLAEAELNLGSTLTELLLVSEDDPSLPLREEVVTKLHHAPTQLKALTTAKRLLTSVHLEEAPWYREECIEEILAQVPQSFNAACNRWRSLYRSAVQQRTVQNRIIGDHTRNAPDRDRAKRLRAQAESQIQILTHARNAFEGDFYSYRYFASEGFLPGYNFPRLPLSAFIPGRRGRRGRDEFISRPRFLAVSEFGPRAVIYHEGARYIINKVNLAFDTDSEELTKFVMRSCSACGYCHQQMNGSLPDLCESCNTPLQATDEVRELVQLQNVTAKRWERITSDEEERQRIGYELKTTFRFSEQDGDLDVQTAEIRDGEQPVGRMTYGDAAHIWRINLGWLRREDQRQRGFVLDVERGYWESNKTAEDNDPSDPMSRRLDRVVPFVEDRRNVLVLRFDEQLTLETMASIQSALKQAIQHLYQLEPSELAAEPLPSKDDRRSLFFYEASEGGAGVLRQLVEDPMALARVARQAIEICHFDSETYEDKGYEMGDGAGCEAACYDCLLDYFNQPDHLLLDRKIAVEVLKQLVSARVESSSGALPRAERIALFYQACDSELERRWLKAVEERHLAIPTHAQHLIENPKTRPDFYYDRARAVIYIDGPPHDTAEQKKVDERMSGELLDRGYLVIRFHHQDIWDDIFKRHPDIFGGVE
ncbi:DEAD/DEAH box helicase [Phycisphaeraceae bacterium D3-23]